MSVIQATSAGYRDMADRSVRITLEFDPRVAAQAVALFGPRGTACAVAALTQAASIQAAQEETIKTEKPGPLCVLACQWCKDPDFWKFVNSMYPNSCADEADAKEFICYACQIQSRKELDTDTEAANLFHRAVREPFIHWKAH